MMNMSLEKAADAKHAENQKSVHQTNSLILKKGEQLKRLFERILREIPPYFLEADEMPYFVDKKHPEYEGEETIVLGDDTAIIFVSHKKFKIISMTEAAFMPFEATENGVLEFYKGVWDAYNVILVEDKSPSYQKGFILTIKEVVKILEIHQSEKQ